MVFKAIPVPNSRLTQWYSYDSLGGFHALIVPTQDKSGFIGRIVDNSNGDLMKQFIGSRMESVADAINNYVNSLVTKGFITSN